jgi:solute carrier family 25 phosphate transporter 23/24/25/41
LGGGFHLMQDRFTVHTGAYRSIWHAFGKIVQEEGVGAMYRGLVPTMVGLVPYSAAYYFVYDTLTRSYRQFKKKPHLDSFETFLIGSFAGKINHSHQIR